MHRHLERMRSLGFEKLEDRNLLALFISDVYVQASAFAGDVATPGESIYETNHSPGLAYAFAEEGRSWAEAAVQLEYSITNRSYVPYPIHPDQFITEEVLTGHFEGAFQGVKAPGYDSASSAEAKLIIVFKQDRGWDMEYAYLGKGAIYDSYFRPTHLSGAGAGDKTGYDDNVLSLRVLPITLANGEYYGYLKFDFSLTLSHIGFVPGPTDLAGTVSSVDFISNVSVLPDPGTIDASFDSTVSTEYAVAQSGVSEQRHPILYAAGVTPVVSPSFTLTSGSASSYDVRGVGPGGFIFEGRATRSGNRGIVDSCVLRF